MTVNIVNPNAPKNVNAATRCASVGLGRPGGVEFGAVGGVVTVGRP
jgi:hypothetical protein